MWKLIIMSVTQKAHADLSRLKGNDKLAFRKYFKHKVFRKMFKRNGFSMGKSTAIIPEME